MNFYPSAFPRVLGACASLCAVAAFLAPVPLQADAPPPPPTSAPRPDWWSVGSPPPVATTGNTPLAIANIGQAKYMAKCALAALRVNNPALANTIEADLVGPGKIIPSWTPPAAGTTQAKEQYAALRIGQLKAIAAPFYTRIGAVDSDWLQKQRIINGTHDYYTGYLYPWSATPAAGANLAIASVGQLKAVFALRFSADYNSDSMPDLWQSEYLAGADGWGPSDDPDHDGLTNLQEYTNHLNPNAADTDGDSVPDYYDAFPLDPTKWAPAGSNDTTLPQITLLTPENAVAL